MFRHRVLINKHTENYKHIGYRLFLQAGKENSQKQVLAYFERTAIGKPDSVFYVRPQLKIGYPDYSYRQFSKS